MAQGLTLDAGALIALERGDWTIRSLLTHARDHNVEISVPAGVVAQTWQGSARQAKVARLLNSPTVDVVPLDDLTARAVGVLCSRSAHSDIVDVSVALNAIELDHIVVTSNPKDIHSVIPDVQLIVV